MKTVVLDAGALIALVLCGRSRTSDVIDATVVLIAKREKAAVVTSDPDDLTRLDPALTIHEV